MRGRDTVVFMYVVLLHYTVPVEEADLILPDHFEWVGRHYRSSDFIAEVAVAGWRTCWERWGELAVEGEAG